ncbi:FKBP-type peptidyl-prolyl cis-trans isomerase [Novosphingobium profundi]|uniref:FKBP-type peptidyl-prolyl cis-trans isomerase n=1 Tax=Novosphingobium profundi TaxID=1774954 RepID=UPI001BDA85A8|nr:FKBP-type peptidyl-prolyl cis-trans isomerase [Novosphingobium profundi]MBT0666839.1 FKBP-type peptidyl-prolyl cis-trans isomerase [Novosphingobium profundi]
MIRKPFTAALLAAVALSSASPLLAQDKSAAPAPEAASPKVKVETLKDGEGETVPPGSFVLVTYKGMLTDGTQFDAAERMPLDLSNVVPGFAQGLVQMKRGGHYRLTIPPELGYGAEASGPIPANSTLVFDIELIDYKTPEEIAQMMAAIQAEQERAAKARIDAAQGGGADPEPDPKQQ